MQPKTGWTILATGDLAMVINPLTGELGPLKSRWSGCA